MLTISSPPPHPLSWGFFLNTVNTSVEDINFLIQLLHQTVLVLSVVLPLHTQTAFPLTALLQIPFRTLNPTSVHSLNNGDDTKTHTAQQGSETIRGL